MDLFADIGNDIWLGSDERLTIWTGLSIAIPQGYEAQIRPRSGLAREQGITVLNAPGTIDSDYRGEIGVLVINLGYEMARIGNGQRIAQLVIAPVARAELELVDALPGSVRGAGGFGSTGE
jgi:dUTP pyrophosphatase